MPVTPYSPLHPPEKHVTHDRMQEILAKRTGAVPPKLEWGKPQWTNAEKTSAYVQSVCGKYSIDRVPTGVYTAWKRLPDTMRNGKPYKEMPIHLGCKDTKAEAELLCQADADAA